MALQTLCSSPSGAISCLHAVSLRQVQVQPRHMASGRRAHAGMTRPRAGGAGKHERPGMVTCGCT